MCVLLSDDFASDFAQCLGDEEERADPATRKEHSNTEILGGSWLDCVTEINIKIST